MARDYVSGETIQCLICGKDYKALGCHINRIHKIDETSYKQQFGIPYTVGLVSAPTAKRHAEECAKNMSPGQRLIYVASARDNLKRQLDLGHCTWRQPVSSVYNQKAGRIMAVNEAPVSERSCYVCGNIVTVRAARVFYKDEMIRCEDCLAPTSRRPPYKMSSFDREKLRQWAEDNPERAKEYVNARSWWSWRLNPFPLLAYAEKWGARLRIMPKLLEVAQERSSTRSSK
jgi:hypothetical protein